MNMAKKRMKKKILITFKRKNGCLEIGFIFESLCKMMRDKIVDYLARKSKSPSMKKKSQILGSSNEKKSAQVKQQKDAQWSFLNSKSFNSITFLFIIS